MHARILDKLDLAVTAMAVGCAPLHSRIADAYIAYLMDRRPDDLPTDIRHLFYELDAALHSKEHSAEEGVVHNSAKHMADTECFQMAMNIVNLRDYLRSSE